MSTVEWDITWRHKHVMQNKPQERTYHRKYVGVLTEINGFKYFVPMSSPKDKDYANGKI